MMITPMLPAEFLRLCGVAGITPSRLAVLAGRSRAQGHAWASGGASVPLPIAEWLQRRAMDPVPVLAVYMGKPVRWPRVA